MSLGQQMFLVLEKEASCVLARDNIQGNENDNNNDYNDNDDNGNDDSDNDDNDNDDSDNDDKDDEGEKEVVFMLARDNIWERAIEYQESERAMATLLSPEWQLSQITTQPF